MPLFVWFFGTYILLVVFLIYVVICGNNKFHRDGCIGWWYRLLSIRIPNFCQRLAAKMFPCLVPKDGRDFTCMGKNGPCRYFIAIFFATIYVVFTFAYMTYCYPYLRIVFPESYPLRQFLSFFVLPWPWVVFIALQIMDPGEITAENVESYLKAYPYDNVLYTRKMCPTLKIPCPARSRFCKYTWKRIAKYDHYCPWVLAPIGERTHRFFLWFLIFNMFAAGYLCETQMRQCVWRIRYLSPKVKWGQKWSQNAFIVGIILLKTDPVISATAFVLGVIVITLAIFILQQMYFISTNKTQVELDKIDAVREAKRRAGFQDTDRKMPWSNEWNLSDHTPDLT